MKSIIMNVETKGHYVYAHILPNKLVYFGRSEHQPCERWKAFLYRGTAIYPYIKQYGWENIEHIVIQDGLTREQAKAAEDWLIRKGKADGLCVNKRRSGDCSLDYKKYRKEYDHRPEVVEHTRERSKEYNKRPKVKEYRKNYNKKYHKSCYSKPEGKIYNRVNSYNHIHPDNIVETPKEAKNKYLEYGYIPSYIKNDDLF